jgi:DNA modification methylase
MSIINLYNIDCMEAMKAMPDKAYDLAIVKEIVEDLEVSWR